MAAASPPSDLVALVEGPSALPPGRALDLGCGTGTDTLYLATHDWEVTAVDMVAKALATAQRRQPEHALHPRRRHPPARSRRRRRLHPGSGLRLPPQQLRDDRRPAYVTSVTHAAAPGATLLLCGFTRPPKAAPMHAGISTDEVRRRFSPAGWDLASAERAYAETLGNGVRRADDRFELWCYQLHRLPT